MAFSQNFNIPNRKPVSEYPTPVQTAVVYSEQVDRNDSSYQENAPMVRGRLYSTIKGGRSDVAAAYPNLFFLREDRVGNSDNFVTWLWATDEQAADTFNAEITYSGESLAAPIYARIYRVRRDVYEAVSFTPAYATALTGLIGIKVTAGGTGYLSTDTVNIAGALGATAQLVVNGAGAIISVVVTAEGSGYDSAALPAVTITTVAGVGATLVAIVQPKTAVLISQKKVEYPQDSPFRSEYVQVLRVYETLPGPWLPFMRRDDNLGPIQGQRRAVLADASQAATLTATGKTTYEAREGSSVVSLQIQENWSDGTGSAGNDAYPVNDGPDFYDNERGSVKTTSQLVIISSPPQAGTLTSSGGTITQVRYEPFDNFHFKKVSETWAETGPSLTGTTQNARGAAGTLAHQLVAPGTAVDTGADVLQSSVNAESIVQSKRETETGALWSNTTGLVRGPFGIPGTITDAVVDKAAAAISAGINIESSTSIPEDKLRNRQRTETVSFDSTTINSKEPQDRGYVPAIARTFVAPNSTPPTQSHLIHVERRLDTLDRSIQDVATFVDGRPLVRKRFNRFGGLDVSTDTYKAPSTVPANTTWTVEELIQEKELEARLVSTVIAAGSAIAVKEKVKNVPGARAVIEAYLVLASSSIPSDTNVIIYEWLEYPENANLRIEKKTTLTIPPDYEESRTQGYYMPTLFTSFYSDNVQGATLFQRGGWTAQPTHRIVHHFGTTKLSPAVYPIIEDDLLVFSYHVRGLTDGVDFHRTVDGVTYTQTRAATTPTEAAYTALIGTEVIASGSSEIWLAGIYETITAYVTLQ